MSGINSALGRFASFAPTILRVVLGALILYHGIDKFRGGGIAGVEEFFRATGVPAPALTAPLTAIIEVVAGAALIVGAFTRLASAAMIVVLIGALIFVKLEGDVLGGGSEVDFAYLAGLFALLLLGPGAVSVDGMINQDDTVIDVRSERVTVTA